MKKLTLKDMSKLTSISPTDTVKIPFEVDGSEIIVEVKPYLKLVEVSEIVDSVTGCFTSEGFAPEYKDVLFTWKVIDVMTNIPVPMLKKDTKLDLEMVYEWATKLNLIDKLAEADDRICTLIIKLESLIDEKLEFQKSIICHPDRDSEIVDAVTGLIGKVSEIVSQYASKMNDVDLTSLAPAIMRLSENKLDKEAIKTILEAGSTSKDGSETAPNLEVIK